MEEQANRHDRRVAKAIQRKGLGGKRCAKVRSIEWRRAYLQKCGPRSLTKFVNGRPKAPTVRFSGYYRP